MERAVTTGILIVFALFFTALSYGQEGKITGKVIDEYGPLPGANVTLMQPGKDDEIRGETTDFEGDFSISAELDEPVFLEITYMGYEVIQTDSLTLSSGQKEIQLDTIEMNINSEELAAVNVTGIKRPVSFSNGKTIVDVENNPMVQGESAFSLLRQLPGVSTGQDGEIQLRGKLGVQVVINGRKTELKGEELKTYLESLPSDAVAHIELDTNPPSEHDAEGEAGILHIQLKESESERFTGNVSAGYTYQDQHLWNSNLFLSQQNKKWDWSVIVDASEKGKTRHNTLHTDFNEEASLVELNQKGKETQNARPVFAQFAANYQLSDCQKVGLNLELGRKKSKRDWNTESSVKEMDNEIIDNRSFNRHRENFDHGLVHAYYQIKMDTLGSNLKISADASKVKRTIKSRFFNELDIETPDEHSELFKAPAKNDYEIFATKADYQKHWENGTEMKFGTKYSQVDFKSHMDFYEVENDVPELDEERSNAFDYDEHIWAVYGKFSTQLHPKWTLNAGLRMEKTWGEGIEQLTNDSHKKDYIDWFPSVSLQQQVNDDYQIEYGYNRRIARPQYEFLNPQIFYIDPYNYSEGNPDLQPQRTHSLSMNHLIKGKYQIGLTYDYYSAYMVEVPMTDTETNQTSFIVQNLKQASAFGVNAYVPIKIADFWDMNNSLTANYQSFKLDLEEDTNRKRSHLFVLFQNDQQIQLPKGIQLNLSINARSPFNEGYYNIHGQWWTDVALKKSFLDDKLDVNIKFIDIFKTMNLDADYRFNGNKSSIKQYMGDRSASVQLTYKFGGENGKQKQKDTDFEEYERIGE